MSARSFRPSVTRCAALAVTAATAVVVLPPAAHAGPRQEVISGYTADRTKIVAARCPDGQHVAGGGAEIIGNNGDVALVALVPDLALTGMAAVAVARPDRTAPWAVAVVAVCASLGWDTPVRVRSTEATAHDGTVTATASCPGGWVLTGTGFDATDATGPALLTVLAPSPDGTAVTVRLSVGTGSTVVPVAYGLCVPNQLYGLWQLRRITPAFSSYGPQSPKEASATPVPIPAEGLATGVGAVVAGPATDVFIDAMVPNPSLTGVDVRATRVRTGTGQAATRTATGTGRAASRGTDGDGSDDYAVGATGMAAVVYY